MVFETGTNRKPGRGRVKKKLGGTGAREGMNLALSHFEASYLRGQPSLRPFLEIPCKSGGIALMSLRITR
jgi:hypothetical protein